jgi:hypothetical protein
MNKFFYCCLGVDNNKSKKPIDHNSSSDEELHNDNSFLKINMSLRYPKNKPKRKSLFVKTKSDPPSI